MKSFFKYEIAQTVQVLLYKMKMGKKWIFEEGDDYSILRDINDPKKVTYVVLSSENSMSIVTAGYFKYTITNLPKDGAEVIFEGPVNALEAQGLKPRVSYIPNTLMAKTENMEDWGTIEDFMAERAERNAGNPNPQDKNGWRVNMKFYNELVPFLPPYHGTFKKR